MSTDTGTTATNTTTGTYTNTNTTATPPKMFTQEEVDKIIDGRFGRMMDKYKDYDDLKEKARKFDELEDANKTELQKANDKAAKLQKELDSLKAANKLRSIREKVAQDTGVPVGLLTANTEEECEAQAKSIMEFAKPNTYPHVKDGGEQTVTGKKTTRDIFADWFDANTKQ